MFDLSIGGLTSFAELLERQEIGRIWGFYDTLIQDLNSFYLAVYTLTTGHDPFEN